MASTKNLWRAPRKWCRFNELVIRDDARSNHALGCRNHPTHKTAKAGFPPVPRGIPPAPAWLLTARSKYTWASFSRCYRLISVCFLISAARVPHGKDYSRLCPGRHGSSLGLQSYLLFVCSTFSYTFLTPAVTACFAWFGFAFSPSAFGRWRQDSCNLL